jgi:MoxR-like ATPase
MTSNRTRELGDGLRRRCLCLHVSYPSPEKELRLVELKVPGIGKVLAKQVVVFMAKIRAMEDVLKKPGTTGTIDWALALVSFGYERLDPGAISRAMSAVLKASDDALQFDKKHLA